MATNRSTVQGLLVLSVIVICFSATGCIGGMAQLMYMIKGHDVPADYAGLEKKRVAVVAVTDSSSYGPDPLATTIERLIGLKLATNAEEIELVPDSEIKNWIDVNDWDQSDFSELGKGVEADFVLGINIDSYTIREGRTIYQGRSEVTITVVESETGKTTYSVGPENYEYPENGRPALQTNDRKFEAFYLAWLTERIARQFYKHDRLEDVADDAAFAG